MVHSEGNVHANEHLANPVPDFNPQSSAYYDSRVRSQSNNLPSGSMARQEREARIEARIQEALGGPREGEDEVPFPSGRIIREAQLRRSETTVMSPPRRGTDRISRLPRSETDFGLAGRSLSPLRMTQESRVSGFGPGGGVRYHHRRTETQTTIRRSESFHRSDARNPSHRSSSHRSHPEESRSGRSHGRGERN
jgi:hypothetical protein